MLNEATRNKRKELGHFVDRVVRNEPAIQGIVATGSVANGRARHDSDIDAVVFMEPLDPYAVPAEFRWHPEDGTFHSAFSEGGIQFDFHRVDLAMWSDPSFSWEEGYRAELAEGWLAYDRYGRVETLLQERTAYTEKERLARLDEALIWLDLHLAGNRPERSWETLGATVAHDRLQAAYRFIVQALFAYNRRWQPWRNREMTYLLALPWLSDGFAPLATSCATGHDLADYLNRVESLRSALDGIVARLVADRVYGEDAISEAFIRSHDEPGRAWNMDVWRKRHAGKRG